jgi:DNA-binding NtrC family response regulator
VLADGADPPSTRSLFLPLTAGPERDLRRASRQPFRRVLALIATSSRPLPDDFNPGLVERISATVVTIPPLRDRSGDIPALARHLLARFSDQAKLRQLSIGNDALAVLMRYGWPGNVRQLSGVLFRAGLQCEGTSLTAEDFPHIAIQSRFNGRRSDHSPEITQSKSDEAISGAPSVTSIATTATCGRSRKSKRTSSASRSAITAVG